MNWILFFIFLIIIILVVVVIRLKKYTSLVKENSVKYKKLMKLNESYTFNKNVKKIINIEYFVKSKTELSKINLDELIIEVFKDNTNNVYLNTEYVMKNEEKYDIYHKKYKSIDDVTPAEIISVTNMKLKTFNFLENRLFSNSKLNPLVRTKVELVAKFDTPKGENKYQRNKTFSYNELKEIFSNLKNENVVKEKE